VIPNDIVFGKTVRFDEVDAYSIAADLFDFVEGPEDATETLLQRFIECAGEIAVRCIDQETFDFVDSCQWHTAIVHSLEDADRVSIVLLDKFEHL
jgi:hypothetical protein